MHKLLYLGFKERGTNWPWNWGLTDLKQSRWRWSDHKTNFKMIVRANCAILYRPIYLCIPETPLSKSSCSPHQQLGVGSYSWVKHSFLSYQHLSLKYWLSCGEQSDLSCITIVPSCLIAKKWKQYKCPPFGKWINKELYVHFLSVIKRVNYWHIMTWITPNTKGFIWFYLYEISRNSK